MIPSFNVSPEPRGKGCCENHHTALSHNEVVNSGVSPKAAWLHCGRANHKHKQLNPEKQHGSVPSLQGLDSLQHLKKHFVSFNF